MQSDYKNESDKWTKLKENYPDRLRSMLYEPSQFEGPTQLQYLDPVTNHPKLVYYMTRETSPSNNTRFIPHLIPVHGLQLWVCAISDKRRI